MPYILYTRAGCGRCVILKHALIGKAVQYEESEDYPAHIRSLPHLVTPDGSSFEFKEAMEHVTAL